MHYSTNDNEIFMKNGGLPEWSWTHDTVPWQMFSLPSVGFEAIYVFSKCILNTSFFWKSSNVVLRRFHQGLQNSDCYVTFCISIRKSDKSLIEMINKQLSTQYMFVHLNNIDRNFLQLSRPGFVKVLGYAMGFNRCINNVYLQILFNIFNLSFRFI